MTIETMHTMHTMHTIHLTLSPITFFTFFFLYILDLAYVKVRKIALMTNHIRGPKDEIRVLCGALAGCEATRPCGAECSIERSEPVHDQVYPTSKYISRAVLPPPLDASSVARWPKLVYIYTYTTLCTTPSAHNTTPAVTYI